ncbi:hypothetical protein LIER_15661 [Lithospermum erythrorhizon]|uniref:NAD(P)-binding domain-containing protein n=1 Tax=Lithospermum erythrorhizon TaxID=34254 RepID=A0AAV3Q925_LITER
MATQNLPVGVRKTIQSIREIVGNHSDADIYSALKDSNMDPNETTQKLLYQDPFHEVRRRRDKKKEIQNEGLRSSTTPEPRQNSEQVGQERKPIANTNQSVRRSGHIRASGVSHQFRVVRDNRVNQNKVTNLELRSTPPNDPASSSPVNSSSVGTFTNQKPPFRHQLSQSRNGPSHLQPRQSRETNTVGTTKKVLSEDKLAPLSGTRLQNAKINNTQLRSMTSSNSSAIGVYSSSSDPVHVPSHDSRQAGNVGAIKREVGVVGARRQSSESGKISSISSNLLSNHSQNVTPESTAPASSVGRSFSNNHNSSKTHQSVGHAKAPQPSKEWKPKLNKKATTNGAGAIGIPTKAASHSHNSESMETGATQLKDNHSPRNVSENQNVIIAAHIRVSDSDRYRLTFGSLGAECETASSDKAAGIAEASISDRVVSVSVPAPVSPGDEPGQIAELSVDSIQSSDSNASASAPLPKHELADKKDSSISQNMDNYGDNGLIRDDDLAYSASEPQHQVASELPSFSTYDQTGYNIPYLRSPADEAFRRQGLQSPQEALSSHTANSIPATTIALSQQQQQQQQQLAQMYPQLHYMPYRQVFPPFYVPPMAMPGYSSNPAYPHPSNGSSFVLMPGGSSHLNSGNVKYGMQQFKPVPTASPSGFGNYSNPTGYAMNTPGVVGGGTGLEEAPRFKYKDNHLYVPNAQVDASEMWMNTKEIPTIQSASYYNMPGQTPHATAYLSSHAGHASQSSHMQFPAMYHPPQPGAIASPHPLGAAMVGNVGATATAPPPQVRRQVQITKQTSNGLPNNSLQRSVLCFSSSNKKKQLSFVDQILDYIQGGPKLRKWYGAPELLPKDGSEAEEDESLESDEVRDAVLVTDGDNEIGQMIILSLIVKRVRVKALVKDKRVALEAFGTYVESIPGDPKNTTFMKKALRGVCSVVCPTEGSLPNAESWKGVQHVILLSQLLAYKGASGIQAIINSNARKMAEESEYVIKELGLPYTIIRAGLLQNTPGGEQGFNFKEGSAEKGTLTKEDAAFICVEALDAIPETGLIFEVANGEEKVEDWKMRFSALMETSAQ